MRQVDEARRGRASRAAQPVDTTGEEAPERPRSRDQAHDDEEGEEETLDYYEGPDWDETDFDDAWGEAYDEVDDEEEDDYEGET